MKTTKLIKYLIFLVGSLSMCHAQEIRKIVVYSGSAVSASYADSSGKPVRRVLPAWVIADYTAEQLAVYVLRSKHFDSNSRFSLYNDFKKLDLGDGGDLNATVQSRHCAILATEESSTEGNTYHGILSLHGRIDVATGSGFPIPSHLIGSASAIIERLPDQPKILQSSSQPNIAFKENSAHEHLTLRLNLNMGLTIKVRGSQSVKEAVNALTTYRSSGTKTRPFEWLEHLPANGILNFGTLQPSQP